MYHYNIYLKNGHPSWVHGKLQPVRLIQHSYSNSNLKTKVIKQFLTSDNGINTYIIRHKKIFVDKNCMIIELDTDIYDVIMIGFDGKGLYVNKKVWTKEYGKLKSIINYCIKKKMEEDWDITYSSEPGKHFFHSYKSPKFKTIKEMKDYSKELLQNWDNKE